MKKIAVLLLTGVILSTGIRAQTKDVKSDQKDLKNTIKDKKEDRHEVGKDITHLKVKSALKDRKEVRHHRKSIHRQDEQLENQGVKHPTRKAKHQLKGEKELNKAKS